MKVIYIHLSIVRNFIYYVFIKKTMTSKFFTVTFQNTAIQTEKFLTRNLIRGFSGWRGFPKRSLSASSSINSTYEAELEI